MENTVNNCDHLTPEFFIADLLFILLVRLSEERCKNVTFTYTYIKAIKPQEAMVYSELITAKGDC